MSTTTTQPDHVADRNRWYLSAAPIVRALVHLCVPMAAAMVVSAVYNVINAGFIGSQHDTSLLAAITFGTPLLGLVMAVGGVFGVGGSALMSRMLGAAEHDPSRAQDIKHVAAFSLWGAVMGHANLILHGAGWMEGGLVASFEKLVVDVELIQSMVEFLQPLVVNEDTLGFEAMKEVGPGGHFFGAAHTLERYEKAFYSPLLSDWRNFENWRLGGALDAAQRANQIWKTALAEFAAPVLDPGIDEGLRDFVERYGPATLHQHGEDR